MKQPAIDYDLLERQCLDAAVESYPGDLYDGDDQYLFALLCDLTRIAAARAGNKPVTEVTVGECAELLGPVIANVCPGAVITDDLVMDHDGNPNDFSVSQPVGVE